MSQANGGSKTAVRVGRVSRGMVAATALGANSLFALLMLTWSCCSSPRLSERVGNPLFWGMACGAVTAV